MTSQPYGLTTPRPVITTSGFDTARPLVVVTRPDRPLEPRRFLSPCYETLDPDRDRVHGRPMAAGQLARRGHIMRRSGGWPAHPWECGPCAPGRLDGRPRSSPWP